MVQDTIARIVPAHRNQRPTFLAPQNAIYIGHSSQCTRDTDFFLLAQFGPVIGSVPTSSQSCIVLFSSPHATDAALILLPSNWPFTDYPYKARRAVEGASKESSGRAAASLASRRRTAGVPSECRGNSEAALQVGSALMSCERQGSIEGASRNNEWRGEVQKMY
jgi:hypothetical protein